MTRVRDNVLILGVSINVIPSVSGNRPSLDDKGFAMSSVMSAKLSFSHQLEDQ